MAIRKEVKKYTVNEVAHLDGFNEWLANIYTRELVSSQV